MSAPVSNEAIHTLQHALGIDKRRREPWRNYYCAADGALDLEALVSAGSMRRGCTLNGGRDRYYHVTEAGIALAKANLPAPLSPAKRRYERFLDLCDVWPDLTFKEFLRLPEARQ